MNPILADVQLTSLNAITENVDCLIPASMCNNIGIICADVKFGGRTTVIIVLEVGGY